MDLIDLKDDDERRSWLKQRFRVGPRMTGRVRQSRPYRDPRWFADFAYDERRRDHTNMKVWLRKNLRAAKGQGRRYEYCNMGHSEFIYGLFFYERKDAIQFMLAWM